MRSTEAALRATAAAERMFFAKEPTSEADFRQCIIWISVSRLAGTLLAQALFMPAALVIAWTATQI